MDMNETLEHMTIDDIIEHVTALGGVLTLRPQPGDGTPEISWGDVFFYYAPDGQLPKTQPFATIVTKDYPDEPGSGLDRADAFRLNIFAGAAEFRAVTGREPREPTAQDVDPSTPTSLSRTLSTVTSPGSPSSTRPDAPRARHSNCWTRPTGPPARFQRRSGEAAP